MHIKLLVDYPPYGHGSVVAVPEGFDEASAQSLIAQGYAEATDAPPPAAEPEAPTEDTP